MSGTSAGSGWLAGLQRLISPASARNGSAKRRSNGRARSCCSNAPDSVRRVLLGLNCLSESLRQRDDAGEAPLALRRRDMLCFRERLYRLHGAGRLADTYYFDAAMCVRQFLRESVMFGLYESGGPLHGLSANFAVHDDDIPVKPRDEDDVGRALPQVVMDQLMSRESLALLPNDDMRALVQVEADIGRRPEEACALRALCLTTSDSVNQATGEMESHWLLVHDMPKVGVVNHKLAIADATARVILEQQQRVKARYPGTPFKQLALFPRVGKNADGTVWIGSSTFSRVVRSGWLLCRSFSALAVWSSRASWLSPTRSGTAMRSGMRTPESPSMFWRK